MSQSGTFALKSYDWQGGTLECRWWVNDRGDNKSDVIVELWGHTSGFRTYGTGYFTFRINGGDGNWGDGTVDVSGAWKQLGRRTATVDHGANGALNGFDIGVLAGEVYGTSFNSISYSGVNLIYVNATDYVVAPYAPQNLRIEPGTVATTSFGVRWDQNSHDAIDLEHAYWATDPGFTNVVWIDEGGRGYSNPAGALPNPIQLNPGTTYYVRVYSHTSAGWGPPSAAISQVTLPATPPGLTVSSSPSGYQATLNFTPPGGVTGVNPYRWERRKVGGATEATADTPSSTTTVDNLIPGQAYEWRASAFIGAYQSPWTGWQALTQAKPNVNPGDYFDGNTPDLGDINYGWTGAANASTTTAVASGVEGWQVWTKTAGGAVLYRVTAGLYSAYAARVQVIADTTAAGDLHAGQRDDNTAYLSEVTSEAGYVGSIYAKPSRAQSLAAVLLWYNAAGTFLSSSIGLATNTPAGPWTRLAVSAKSPANAAFAAVRAIDVAGTGWSIWHGGDTMDLDGAMVALGELFPYFDGSTSDDATYLYDWIDPEKPHASPSKRTSVAQAGARALDARGRSARAILDPSCIPPSPPRPPTIPSDCIVEAGIWRRTFAKIPATDISDWLSVVPTFEIVTKALNVSQVRIRVYPNPTDGPPELVDGTTWISEQIVSYVPANTVLTIDGVHQRVWAEVEEGESISADHLLYGSNGSPPSWPVLSCGISYALSVDLPVEIQQGDSRLYTYLTTRY